MSASINPFYAARLTRLTRKTSLRQERPRTTAQPGYAKLPRAPITGSPVPHLTSLYHFDRAGDYGSRAYPGNCGGNLIKDLLRFYRPASVFDPMNRFGPLRCRRRPGGVANACTSDGEAVATLKGRRSVIHWECSMRAVTSSSSRGSSSRSSSPFDLYQTVTDQIVAMLDKGVVPWRSPILGKSSAGYPTNFDSKKRYRGVNVFLLAVTAWAKGYESSHWLTLNQARANGGSVKKGEKSSLVVFWKPLEVADAVTGEKKGAFVLRYYNVFNVVQCDGIAAPDAPAFTPSEYSPVEAASVIVQGYADGPAIHHQGGSAFYRPGTDDVTLPELTRFATTNEYYSTLFHELAHSTGHSSRLARGLDTELRAFGSLDYGREELIAEMAAAFLCGESGIVPSVIDNQAAYLQGCGPTSPTRLNASPWSGNCTSSSPTRSRSFWTRPSRCGSRRTTTAAKTRSG